MTLPLLFEIAASPKPRQALKPSEDLAGFSGSTFWLMDGHSSPARLEIPAPYTLSASTLVQWADAALRETLAVDPAADIETLLEQLDAALYRRLALRYGEIPVEQQLRCTPHTTLVIGQVRNDQLHYAMLQDSSILVAHPGRAPLILKDRRQDLFNASFYEQVNASLVAGDLVAYNELLDNMVNREREYRNRADGFATLTGLADSAALAVKGTVPFPAGSVAVLASDGAARYWETFGQNSDDVIHKPLNTVLSSVREFESTDEACLWFPRLGSQDDATVLRVTAPGEVGARPVVETYPFGVSTFDPRN
jgi:hypothetical protein